MAKPFSALTQKFSETRKERVARGVELLSLEYGLVSQLRKDKDLTQQELAELLEIRQSAISKLESQDDVMLQTLERYVNALGGELEVKAKFPDREVKLTQFLHKRAPGAENPQQRSSSHE